MKRPSSPLPLAAAATSCLLLVCAAGPARAGFKGLFKKGNADSGAVREIEVSPGSDADVDAEPQPEPEEQAPKSKQAKKGKSGLGDLLGGITDTLKQSGTSRRRPGQARSQADAAVKGVVPGAHTSASGDSADADVEPQPEPEEQAPKSKQPKKGKSGLGGLLEGITDTLKQSGSSQRRPGQARSQADAAARGVGKAGAGSEGKKGGPGREWLEGLRIGDSEVSSFIDEGGLAP